MEQQLENKTALLELFQERLWHLSGPTKEEKCSDLDLGSVHLALPIRPTLL